MYRGANKKVKFHPYFQSRRNEQDREDITDEWIERVTTNPLRVQVQPNGRIRNWGWIDEKGRYLRVVLEADNETIFNAFFDRRFKP